MRADAAYADNFDRQVAEMEAVKQRADARVQRFPILRELLSELRLQARRFPHGRMEDQRRVVLDQRCRALLRR